MIEGWFNCFLLFSAFINADLQRRGAVRRPSPSSRMKTRKHATIEPIVTALSAALAGVDVIPTASNCNATIGKLTVLFPGDHICSSDGVHTFGLSGDGNLEVRRGFIQVWSAGTCCRSSHAVATIQKDGNFVVRNDLGIQWSSRTAGKVSDTRVSLHNDGSVTIMNKGNGKMLTITPSIGGDGTLTTLPTSPKVNACIRGSTGPVTLKAGQFLCSSNKRFFFGIDVNGKFGLFDRGDEVWSIENCCPGNNRVLLFQKDGNLVLRNSSNQVVWSTLVAPNLVGQASISLSDSGTCTIASPGGSRKWAVAPNPPKSLCQKQVNGSIILQEGQFICSESAQFRFGVFDGGLSLWEYNSLRWSAGAFRPGAGAQMQLRENGKLVLVNTTNQESWVAKASQSMGASLRLGNDGQPQLLSSSGKVLWKVGGKKAMGLMANNLPPSRTHIQRPVPSPIPTQAQISSVSGQPEVALISPTSSSASPESEHSVVPTPSPTQLPTFFPWEWPSLRSPRLTQMPRQPSSEKPVVSSPDPPQTLVIKLPSPTPMPSPPEMTAMSPIPQQVPVVGVIPGESWCIEATSGLMLLRRGAYICSPNGQFKFGLSLDGTLAFLEDASVVWKAESTGSSATLQKDGDLVLLDRHGSRIWSTNTGDPGNDGACLVVGNDGVAAVRTSYRGYVWSTAVATRGRVMPDSLYLKVMTGYQGWFHAKGDGSWNQWVHWSVPLTTPNNDTLAIDLWPDASELDDDELFPTELLFSNGLPASVYSASVTKTVERHCRWMQDYNIDGLFLQRFIGSAIKYPTILDKVLRNVRSGSEKYGRVFSVMYDVGSGNNKTLVEDLISDWMRLVDEQNVTASSQYLHHRGRPLLTIWGLGFHDRYATPAQALAILDWFQYQAADKYKVTLVGGIPAGWRDLSRDSKREPEWMSIYRRFDVLSPWTVGRMNDRSTDFFLDKYIIPDVKECEREGIDYLPVVFPGFSSFHQKGKPLNEIPRLAGNFLWHQLYNALSAGNSMVYVAMFDEVDEGTAIFKVAATREDAPAGAQFLTLDADGQNLPSDWYLQVVGEAAKHVHEGIDLPLNISISPRRR